MKPLPYLEATAFLILVEHSQNKQNCEFIGYDLIHSELNQEA